VILEIGDKGKGIDVLKLEKHRAGVRDWSGVGRDARAGTSSGRAIWRIVPANPGT